jgi:hypothetical protein
MNENPKVQTLNGKPYFINEIKPNIFAVVRSITPSGTEWTQHYADIDELVLGRDLSEIPMHGLSLLVKQPDNECQGQYIIAELRKFARKANFDYVSAEKFADMYSCRAVAKVGRLLYLEVRPRVFIPNN